MTSLKWSPTESEWSDEASGLLLHYALEKPPPQTLEKFIENSANFTVKFPTDTVRCKFLRSHTSKDVLEKNLNSAYVIIHHRAVHLFCNFIVFKRKYGSDIEKNLYKNMSLKEFIDRLLSKRAVSFLGAYDKYMLLNGKKGSGGWESVGKNGEKPPLVLEQCLSYDEIKCSVFLNVSSYTCFVNQGDRKNMAKFSEDRSNIEENGIIVGLIGPRLKKANVMEYQEMVYTDKQTTSSNGYGSSVQNSLPKLFSEFYEDKCRDFREIIQFKESPGTDKKRFVDLNSAIFDNHIYYKRMTISFDTMLLEANYRAKCAGRTAYLHVVGLGLGVWRISPHQGDVFMDTFADRIEILGKHLHSISDICFSYITPLKCGNYKHGDLYKIKDHPLGGIKIHMYKREPHTKVSQEGQEKLLVVSYAWDGNALPGNEWWLGKLGSSGDSAAASSTQITEIHNPHLNPLVSANNVMVVTDNDVVPFEKYQELVRCLKTKRQREASL